MKKFLGILAAVMVAVISVFSLSGNYKNSAEPQYFYNSQIQRQLIQNGSDIEILFDTNVNNYTNTTISNILTLNSDSKILFKVNGEYIDYDLPTEENFTLNFESTETENNFYISELEITTAIKYKTDSIIEPPSGSIALNANTWYIVLPNGPIILEGLKITNCLLSDTLDNLNQQLTPYIGTVGNTEPETPAEPTTPLIQIGSIITDTIGWFTGIFTGLSTAFYIDGELTTWGTVLFIGVAITLIAMVLKWLISLIKGV